MAPPRVRGHARLDHPLVTARERPARRAPEALAAADEMRRLTAAGNAAVSRSLASAPARPGGSCSSTSSFSVVIPSGRSADAMPGAEHGLDPTAYEAADAAAPPAAMSPRDWEQAGAEAAEGRPVRLPDIRLAQSERMGTTDGISAFLSYTGSVENRRGGLPPSEEEFGVTWWADVDLTDITAFRIPLLGGYVVKATIVHKVTWEVRDGEGPTGQADVKSPTDPVLTKANHQQAADDLTPVMTDLNGRPPRERFWSRGITQRHERYHADEAREKGEEGGLWASQWLEKQTAGTLKEVHDLLWGARSHVVSYTRANTEFPGNEQRAYGDGVEEYRALAAAIRARGAAGGYP